MRVISVFYFPLVYGKFKVLLTSHHKYRGTLQGMLQGTLTEDGLSVSITTRRVHLPVARALRRIDQMTINPTLITPYASFPLLVYFCFRLLSFGSMFWPHEHHLQIIYILLHK